MAAAPASAHACDGEQDAVAASPEVEDGRGDGRGEGEREGAGDVEHAEVLGGLTGVRQHVDDEGEVDGHVHAEPQPAQGHAGEVPVDVAGAGDHEECEPVHDGGDQDEDLPAAGAVRESPGNQGCGDEGRGLDQGAQEDLVRHVTLATAHCASMFGNPLGGL
jgi:hypothetical protein